MYNGENSDREMGQNPPQDQESSGMGGTSPPQDTPQWYGAYTKISPNERRRLEVSQQARRGEEEYQRYKEDRKLSHVNYSGKLGGGCTTLAESRQLSARQQRCQKLERINKMQKYKEETKRREEEEIQKMKAEQRRKAEIKAQREQQWQGNIDFERKRTNDAFLDRLEGKTKVKSPSQMTSSKDRSLNVSGEDRDVSTLMKVFPNYDPSVLQDLLEQNGGSIHDVINFLTQ